MSLLRAKPSIAGVVLADFDAQFSNAFYESQLDDVRNIDPAAIAAAAELAARALHDLALGDDAAAYTLKACPAKEPRTSNSGSALWGLGSTRALPV